MTRKREICQTCCRPQSVCLCEFVTRIENETKIIILQHPAETAHPLNTARLVKLCLGNCTILTGENFSESTELTNLLISHDAILLFPLAHAESFESWLDKQREEITASNPGKKNPKAFIIIDGTWRKAKRLLHQNQFLHELPCLQFLQAPPSRYLIRKSSVRNSLSSLESVAYLLASTDNDPDKYRALTDLMTTMIDMQIAHMGEEIFRENYNG